MPNSTNSTHTGTYYKLRDDSYGAKVNARLSAVSEGDIVRVRKRSGQVVTRYVQATLFDCTHYETGEPTGQCIVALKSGRSGRSGRSSTSSAQSQATQAVQTSQEASQAVQNATRSHNDPICQGILGAFENMPTDVLRSLLVEGRIILDRREPSEASQTSQDVRIVCSNGMPTQKPSEAPEWSSEEPSEESSEETTVVVEEKPKKPDLDSIFNNLMF
jgi:hypothetical protein